MDVEMTSPGHSGHDMIVNIGHQSQNKCQELIINSCRYLNRHLGH